MEDRVGRRPGRCRPGPPELRRPGAAGRLGPSGAGKLKRGRHGGSGLSGDVRYSVHRRRVIPRRPDFRGPFRGNLDSGRSGGPAGPLRRPDGRSTRPDRGNQAVRRPGFSSSPGPVGCRAVSQSCNSGLTPVIDPEIKALTRSRLSHVDQNHVRAGTIAAANAALITAQSRIELAQVWGGGLLASVDGLRFVVPVKSITGPSPKYYGYKRGVTWLNAVNDQVAGVGAMVVRGTPHDSPYTLDASPRASVTWPTIKASGPRQGLRPFPDPDAVEDDEG